MKHQQNSLGSLLAPLNPPAPGPAAPTGIAPRAAPAEGAARDIAGRDRPDITTPDPGWSTKLKKPVDLSFLPPEVRAQVERAIEEKLTVGTWEAKGPHAMVFGIKGGHLQAFEDELLASGWGRYSGSVLVWGWYYKPPAPEPAPEAGPE
jgi:hypothetical protein